MALSTQDNQRRGPGWVDCVIPQVLCDKISVPALCGQMGHWKKDCVIYVPNNHGTGRENAPDASKNRGPLAIEGLISRRLTGPEAKWLCLKMRSLQLISRLQWSLKMAGHLIELIFTYSGTTFLVLTQIIENLNNCRKICDGSVRRQGHNSLLGSLFCNISSWFFSHCFLLCLIILFL